MQNDTIVTEEYWGEQSKEEHARLIQEDTQFHVTSVRKSYIGFAVAYAVQEGYISSIDLPFRNRFNHISPDYATTFADPHTWAYEQRRETRKRVFSGRRMGLSRCRD
nr:MULTISPECIES: hypothetical protein [unclassified Planococcus (in: firmicutes)]